MRNQIAALGLALLAGAALPASAEDRLEPCKACHGADGRSETPGIPSLGGMPAKYVLNQLYMFREGQRVADPMNALAKPMTDDDLEAYGELVSKLPAPSAGPALGPADPARVARVDALMARHRCASCHGKVLGGDGQVPRIRDQREDYLAAALSGCKSSDRAGFDTAMNEEASELGGQDIADLAHVLSRR